MKQIKTLMDEILDNRLCHFNLFTGEEVSVARVYQRRILELGYVPVLCSSVKFAISNCQKKSFDKRPKCYLIQDDLDFMKQDKEWQKVVDIINKSKHIIILKYGSIDKRKAFYKFFENQIVNFERLNDKILHKHIKEELETASDNTIYNLIDICENDYSRILLEIDKIKQFSNATGKIIDESFEILVQQGVIYKPIGDITFKLTDAILTGDLTNTNKYLYQAKLKQEPAILTLSVLYNGFKQILMYQGLGADKSNAVKRTGLTSWQIKQAESKMGAYSNKELARALRIIMNVEQGIKLGLIDDDVAVDYVVLNIM